MIPHFRHVSEVSQVGASLPSLTYTHFTTLVTLAYHQQPLGPPSLTYGDPACSVFCIGACFEAMHPFIGNLPSYGACLS